MLERIRERLRAWQADPTKPQPYVRAWAELVDGPFEQLKATLVGDDERSKALRQATPFSGIVDPVTRWRIWATVREQLQRSP